MLNLLRRGGVVQLFMAAIVFAIIAVFVLEFRAGGGGSPAGSLTRNCAAEVEGRCVMTKDFLAAYGLIVPRGMPAKHVKALSLRRQVLEGLVERELLLADAARIGISVSDEEVDEALVQGLARVSLPAAQAPRLGFMLGLTQMDEGGYVRELIRELPVMNAKTQAFDYELYERVVRNTTGRSAKEFKAMQRKEIIASRMRDLIRSRVQISEEEAFRAFERERSQAVIRFVRLDRDWFAKYTVRTDDETVDRWTAENAEQVDEAWEAAKKSWTGGCPLVSEISVLFEPGSTDDDKAFKRETIEQARSRLDGGEPFGLIARQLSDADTAIVGGALGCLSAETYGEDGASLLEAVQQLERGQVSPVLETRRGFHLLRLDATLEEEAIERTGRRAVARRLMTRSAGGEHARKLAAALIEEVGGGATLDAATEALALPFLVEEHAGKAVGDDGKPPALQDASRPRVEISGTFNIDGSPIGGVLPGVSPARIALALDEPDAVHPEPIATIDGWAVLQLKEKTAAERDDFEAEKQTILRQLRLARRADALIRYVARLRDEAGDRIKIDPRVAQDPRSGDEGPGEG